MKNNDQFTENLKEDSENSLESNFGLINDKNEEIKQLKEELLHTNQYINEFVYAAAHALRSPVANLNLITILLEKTHDINEIKSYLETIKCSVKRLDQTIHGMVLGFQAKTMEGKPELITLATCVDTVLMKIKGNLNCLSAKFSGNFESCPEIYYNKEILSEILNILIQNAFNFKSDQTDLQIEVKSERHGDTVLIQVKDNGIGIDLEKHGKDIFQPFKKFTSRSQGNGMGLYLAKILINKNKGKINIESKLNIGTTVKCYLREQRK